MDLKYCTHATPRTRSDFHPYSHVVPQVTAELNQRNGGRPSLAAMGGMGGGRGGGGRGMVGFNNGGVEDPRLQYLKNLMLKYLVGTELSP